MRTSTLLGDSKATKPRSQLSLDQNSLTPTGSCSSVSRSTTVVQLVKISNRIYEYIISIVDIKICSIIAIIVILVRIIINQFFLLVLLITTIHSNKDIYIYIQLYTHTPNISL